MSDLYHTSDRLKLFLGDAGQVLSTLESDLFDCCITSPPYWGARIYEVDSEFGSEIGAESSPEEYLESLSLVFAQVLRVIRPKACLWIVIGDVWNNYSAARASGKDRKEKQFTGQSTRRKLVQGYREKEPLLLPFRLVERLRHNGFVHRDTVIWHKPNGAYDAAIDRLPCRHEYVLQFIKPEKSTGRPYGNCDRRKISGLGSVITCNPSRVEGHGATYPTALIAPLILACTKANDLVLDPFIGSGTTAIVARQCDRRCVGIDLSSKYLDLAITRLMSIQERT